MKNRFNLFFILLISSSCFGQIVNFHDEETGNCGQHYIDPTTNADFKSQNIKYKWGIAFKKGKSIYFDQLKMTGSDFYLLPADRKRVNNKTVKNSIILMDSPDYIRVLSSEKNDPFIPLDEGQKIYCTKIENYKMFIKDEKSDWTPFDMTFKGEINKGENYVGDDTMCECLLFNIKTKWFEGNYVYVCEMDFSETAGKENAAQSTPIFPTPLIVAMPIFASITTNMAKQMELITEDQRSGKITGVQAKTAFVQIEAIRSRMMDYVKANGDKDLTPTQESEIKSALATNAKSL